MQKRNKAIVAGLSVSAVAAAVALTGSTSAYYYDLETSENSMTACGFDLDYTASAKKMDGDEAYGRVAEVTDGKTITLENVAPGDTFDITAKVTNTGDCEGDLWVQATNIQDSENDFIGPEADVDESETQGELGQYVTWSVDGWTGGNIGEISAIATPVNLVDHFNEAGILTSGESLPVTFHVEVPEGDREQGNDIMSDSFSFDFDVALVQHGQDVTGNLA